MANKQIVYRVEKYKTAYYSLWNNFVKHSKNATFLFHRDFMEYHSERFDDFSLVIFKDDELVALLPANRVDDTVFSHQGLSYGGLLLSKRIKLNAVLECVKAILQYLETNSIKYIVLKETPVIYNLLPSDELNYLLFILKAELIRTDVLSVISKDNKLKIANNRMEGVKRARKNNLQIKEDDENLKVFWETILVKNLKERYGVSPVHSYEEIKMLKQSFPNNIKFFGVYHNEKMVAGNVVFESANVAHVQYISADENRSVLGSLDFLHYHLLTDVYNDKLYFDFGCSNINAGKQINKGLQTWKEGFGARAITQNFYKVNVTNYKLLDTVFV